MTTAKKKADAKTEAEEPEVNAAADAGPVKTTEVTWNGLTAHDTIDGVEQPARPATLAEQLSMISNDLLSLVVGSVPYATSGTVTVDDATLTIHLTSH